MLSEREQTALSLLDLDALHRHFRVLASFVRRSDGDGERAAREYVRSRLENADIPHEESSARGILAFGGEGRIVLTPCFGESGRRTFGAAAWNFSAPAEAVVGRARVLEAGDFPLGPLDYLSSRIPYGARRDLEGGVVLSRFVSAEAVLDAQSRGAAGFVICWAGGREREIHRSGISLGWGTPMPEEACWSPGIPVLAVNAEDGDILMDAAKDGAELSLSCTSPERIADVPLLEARIPSTAGEPYFLLVGAHLDSKHYGATDNATGAAIALTLAEALARVRDRRWGVRVCWWSGHEFGKYAGSSLYARDRFDEVDRYCLAYSNIDMPGMLGAVPSRVVTAGPDLFALADRTLRDVVGRSGALSSRVRAWDQSFQNIGVSPFFIWTSALPPDSPHRTGEAGMPWWWHTEADTAEFCDPKILEADAALYVTAALRLLSVERSAFDISALWDAVLERVRELESALRPWLDLAPRRRALEEGRRGWLRAPSLPFSMELRAVRLLNRIFYAARDAHLQDWSGGSEFVPGLSEALRVLRRGVENPRAETIVVHYAGVQSNRLGALASELASLVGRGEAQSEERRAP